MKKVYFLQRAVAYLIDVFIVSIIGMAIGYFLVFRTDAYNKAVKNTENIPKTILSGEINDENKLEEYKKDFYIIEKNSGLSTIVQLVISVFYFGSYAYYKDGKTLGKKIMKIKVVSEDGSDLSHGKFIIRAALLSGLFTEFLSLLFLLLTDYSKYYTFNSLFDGIYTIFIFVSIFMIIFRKDNKGLHDLIIKSKIISTEKCD